MPCLCRWTPENVDRLRAMRATVPRIPVTEIASALGTTSNAIMTKLSRLGLSPTTKMTPAESDRLVRMREAGASYGQISMALGKAVGTIRAYCLLNGIESPNPSQLQPDRYLTHPVVVRSDGTVARAFTPADDAVLRAMSMSGDSYADMGRKLGRTGGAAKIRLCTLARYEQLAEDAA
jgi:hypothetical protein